MITITEIPLEPVWRIRQEVMYPEQTIEQVKLDDDASGIHKGLFEANKLCTVISLFERGEALQFRKFATIREMQGRGFGSALLNHVFANTKAKGLRRIWCNARTTAIPFYERFGMLAFGDTWQQNGRLFVKMQIEL